jgi:phage tail-like protein
MAQDKDQIKSTYPLPAYNYRVTILKDGESLVLGFAEVSGLSVEYEAVTYKHGLSFVMGAKIIPGMRQPIRLTMKRGVVQHGDFLYSWINSVYTDPFFTSAKRDILIDLCDEKGAAVVRWNVQGALPVKLDAPTFDANTNEVAIETMEFVVHGVTVNYNP